jgi:hypothetical protein
MEVGEDCGEVAGEGNRAFASTLASSCRRAGGMKVKKGVFSPICSACRLRQSLNVKSMSSGSKT